MNAQHNPKWVAVKYGEHPNLDQTKVIIGVRIHITDDGYVTPLPYKGETTETLPEVRRIIVGLKDIALQFAAKSESDTSAILHSYIWVEHIDQPDEDMDIAAAFKLYPENRDDARAVVSPHDFADAEHANGMMEMVDVLVKTAIQLRDSL